MRALTPVTEFTQTEVARDGQSALLLSLRFLRGDRSLEEVAGQAGIRADELSRIERGLTKQIRWETLLRLMRTYECRPDELLEVKENTSGAGLGTPREFMLAAIEAGVGGHVPTRRLQFAASSSRRAHAERQRRVLSSGRAGRTPTGRYLFRACGSS